jgi:hypothetical protein
MSPCQSCKTNSVEVVDDCDNPAYPYRVCKGCHDRLLSRSLRPREYFNLAAKHGMTYLLHDDFYGNDGTAYDPQIELEIDASLAFPKLAELTDLKSILDYAIVEWWLSDVVVNAIKKFEKKEVLKELDARIISNKSLSSRIYQLAAFTLGNYADEWIVKQWQFRTDDNFPDFAEALAKCLEPDLGFELYSKQLERIEQPSKLTGTMTGLIYFQSKLALAWIEANTGRVSNISDAWGYLAVASQFDWATAEKWLGSGRPLSLIALDALGKCAVTSDTQNSTLWLKNNPQRLLSPKTIEEMNNILFKYGESDKVPRVRTKINYIIANWDKILKQ